MGIRNYMTTWPHVLFRGEQTRRKWPDLRWSRGSPTTSQIWTFHPRCGQRCAWMVRCLDGYRPAPAGEREGESTVWSLPRGRRAQASHRQGTARLEPPSP